jgi:hypothetical protein
MCEMSTRAVFSSLAAAATAAVHAQSCVVWSVPPQGPNCAADLGATGGIPGHDGTPDNNDFIVSIADVPHLRRAAARCEGVGTSKPAPSLRP